MTTVNIRNLCVYCGSSPGSRPDYVEAARALGNELVRRDIGLVYGGAQVGVMGAVADAVLEAGGRAVGIIPRSLVSKEIAHDRLTELVVTQSMHERKTIMAHRADGFIALPGGMGTLEELFEMWTWAQLGYHDKPIGGLNVAGYYDRLVDFVATTVAEGFVRPDHRDIWMVESDPSALVERMIAYEPKTVSKW